MFLVQTMVLDIDTDYLTNNCRITNDWCEFKDLD